MGHVDGVIGEIRSVSETEPNAFWPNSGGLFVATFACFIEPAELTEHFKGFRRSFVLFELDKNTSGFHIANADVQEGLFGSVLNKDMMDTKTNDLLNEIQMSSTTSTAVPVDLTSTTVTSRVQHIVTDEQIQNMSPRERDDLWNSIMDKGVENLTDLDKKLLRKLSK
jgi:hypothetical protein